MQDRISDLEKDLERERVSLSEQTIEMRNLRIQLTQASKGKDDILKQVRDFEAQANLLAEQLKVANADKGRLQSELDVATTKNTSLEAQVTDFKTLNQLGSQLKALMTQTEKLKNVSLSVKSDGSITDVKKTLLEPMAEMMAIFDSGKQHEAGQAAELKRLANKLKESCKKLGSSTEEIIIQRSIWNWIKEFFKCFVGMEFKESEAKSGFQAKAESFIDLVSKPEVQDLGR